METCKTKLKVVKTTFVGPVTQLSPFIEERNSWAATTAKPIKMKFPNISTPLDLEQTLENWTKSIKS